MISKLLKPMAAAALLAAAVAPASAAPATSASKMAPDAGASVIYVHGDHRHCARDRYGWHRHNRYGERRHCRRWDGRGRRPDSCVKVGPAWFCDW